MQNMFEENNYFHTKDNNCAPPKHPKIQKFENNSMNVAKIHVRKDFIIKFLSKVLTILCYVEKVWKPLF
jgi:hypothetical protein